MCVVWQLPFRTFGIIGCAMCACVYADGKVESLLGKRVKHANLQRGRLTLKFTHAFIYMSEIGPKYIFLISLFVSPPPGKIVISKRTCYKDGLFSFQPSYFCV